MVSSRMTSRARTSIGVLIAVWVMAAAGHALAGGWAGTYMTHDTKGNEMRITLMDDGIAVGSKHSKTLDGTWTDDDGAAVISWTTGWTTKLSKDGDTYIKSAFRPGTPMKDGPAHTGPAEKVD